MTAINNRFECKTPTEQRTSKGGMTMSKMRPTDKPKAHREAVYRGVYQEVDDDSTDAAY